MEMYGNQRGKHLCTEMCGIVRKSVKQNCAEMCGNQIWLRSGFILAFQLDLNCSENAKKKYCKKLLVEIKYKTKDNLTLKYSRP